MNSSSPTSTTRSLTLYPAVDIMGGRCVRLRQGNKKDCIVYDNDPTRPALAWKAAGAEWCHVVDLDGAFEGSARNSDVLAKIAATGLKVQTGGGIRTRERIVELIDLGISRIVIGTIAQKEPETLAQWIKDFGDRIAAGLDARDGKVAIKGWVENTNVSVVDLALKLEDAGLSTLIFTDIGTDGMMAGPCWDRLEEVLSRVNLQVIASGGISSLDDIHRLSAMTSAWPHLHGAIIGKALYERAFTLKEAFEVTDEFRQGEK